ncbi:MAG: class I SAM-dependent methyltransferase [Candidatus Hermodarchaeota archaeon]
MSEIIFPHVLYTFLDFIFETKIEKKVLDCGAGGNNPKMALFVKHGFETHGIEILEDRLEMAENYSKRNKVNFKIIKGDMRSLPYDSESYGFAYSYNTIFHMNQGDIGIAINEMFRVVKKGGLIYLNLLSIDDSRYGRGKEISPGIFMEEFNGERFSHTFFKHDEGDQYFLNHKIIYKQIRIENYYESDYSKRGMIDYIVRK